MIPKGVLLQILENIDNYKDQIRERQMTGEIADMENMQNIDQENLKKNQDH